ncbi:MAG: PspC domain-containing protein [Chloroflexia bacterium]|nr:PspC domain-containing protein [Chloroflexia bacterium]
MATVVVPEAPRELEEPAPRWRLPVENHVLWGGLLVLAGIYFLFKTFGRYAHTWAPDLARYWDLLWASIRGLALPAVLIGIGLLLVFGVARRGEHKPTRRLTRSGDDRIIAGVCGGLGRFLKIDSTWIRLGFVGLTLTGGVGLLLYLVAVLAMPEEISRELTVPQEPELD